MNLVAIDTMHLFPTTLECAKLVEARGRLQGWEGNSATLQEREEFIAKYGDCEEMDSADFDFVSKALKWDSCCTWQDIIEYVDKEGVPVNSGHNWAFRCDAPIEATSRHLPDLPWTKAATGVGGWRLNDDGLLGVTAYDGLLKQQR
eukprot:Skav230951  [mRNA]  locus=scaffold3010:82255:91141:- [translate_table: standard]